jgi:hypothetical protein
MPRFYFDVTDTGRVFRDTEGSEFQSLEHARKEALATLGGIARDELPDGDVRDFVIRLRSEEGSVASIQPSQTGTAGAAAVRA